MKNPTYWLVEGYELPIFHDGCSLAQALVQQLAVDQATSQQTLDENGWKMDGNAIRH